MREDTLYISFVRLGSDPATVGLRLLNKTVSQPALLLLTTLQVEEFPARAMAYEWNLGQRT